MTIVKKFFLALTRFALMMQTAPDVLYFKSDNGKYIYFVILGDHCPDHATFYSLFPEASQITESQYMRALKNDVEMILVGDAKDVDRLEPEDPTSSEGLRSVQ